MFVKPVCANHRAALASPLGSFLLPFVLLVVLAATKPAVAQDLTMEDVVAAADRAGSQPAPSPSDMNVLRRALSDPELQRSAAEAGQAVEFDLAIARALPDGEALKREAYVLALKTIDRDIARTAASDTESLVAQAGRKIDVLREFIEFLDNHATGRLLAWVQPGTSDAEHVRSLGRLVAEIRSNQRILLNLLPPCDSPAACERRAQVNAANDTLLGRPAIVLIEHLVRAISREDAAYDDLNAFAQSAGRDHRYNASARGFGQAAVEFRAARAQFSAAFPDSSLVSDRLNALAMQADSRAADISRIARQPAFRQDFPEDVEDRSVPPPADTGPPPSPRQPVEQVTLGEISAFDRAGSVALTPYQEQCQPGADGLIQPSADVSVYYATTRARAAKPKPDYDLYFEQRPDALSYGRAHVNVPCKRRPGELHRTRRVEVVRISLRSTEFILSEPQTIAMRADWLAAVDGDVQRGGRHELFVFIHGFNTTFARASYRAAQLHADLGIDGATVFYSWPSAASLFGYKRDRRTAESDEQVNILADLLIDLRRNGATTVYLAGHSLGNELLLRALARVRERTAEPVAPFQELILGSADVTQGRFRALWPTIEPLVERATLYSSSRDSALAAAKLVGDPEQRIGDASREPFVFGRLQTVDTTAVSMGSYGHDDFMGAALDDVRGTIWLSLAPESRCILEARTAPSTTGAYWAVTVDGTPDCRMAGFGDAVELTRLLGSPDAAAQWVSGVDTNRWQIPETIRQVADYLQGVGNILKRLRARSGSRDESNGAVAPKAAPN